MNDTPRRTIRNLIADEFGDGIRSTTTGAGTATSIVDSERIETDGHWKGAEAAFLSGALIDKATRITASVSTGTLTMPTQTGAPGAGIIYDLFRQFTISQYNNAINEAVRRATGIHFLPMLWNTITIASSTYDYAIPHKLSATTITIDAGSTTTALRDSALTEANDYWNGAVTNARSGTAGNLGSVRNVTDFLASTDDLVIAPALPATPAAADTYRLFRPAIRYIYYIEYLPSGATVPIPLADRDYSIVNKGQAFLRFNPSTMPSVGSTVNVYALRDPEPPTHDYDPVEVPDDYAINLAYWQLLRAYPQKEEYQIINNGMNRREAWEKAQLDLLRNAFRKPASAKRVF